MSKHSHVETVDRMTEAIFSQDHDTLAAIFTDGFVFHHRSPLHLAGDYKGVGGLLETLGYFFEATGGDIKLDQKYLHRRGRLGHRVGARHARPQRQDPRVGQLVRLPIRWRPHRRDVDVPRRSPGRRRSILRLGAGDWSSWTSWRPPAPRARQVDGETRGGRCPRSPSTSFPSTTSTGSRHRRTSPVATRRRSASGPRAFQRCVEGGTTHRAAAFGASLARALGFKGDLPRCGGWIQRVAELLEAESIDCVEQGWLEYGLGFGRLFEHGDIPGAHASSRLPARSAGGSTTPS